MLAFTALGASTLPAAGTPVGMAPSAPIAASRRPAPLPSARATGFALVRLVRSARVGPGRVEAAVPHQRSVTARAPDAARGQVLIEFY